jgi:transcriptional antiterminator
MTDEKPVAGFVPLKSLKGEAPKSPQEVRAEIRRIYFNTTRRTIQNDFAQAIELLKSLPDEDEREKATVYMEGLAQMRKDWTKVKDQRPKVKSRK